MGYTYNQAYQKSTLNAYNAATQSVAVNGLVNYTNHNVHSGCAIEHVDGGTSVRIRKPGLYLVEFNSEVVATTIPTSGGTTIFATLQRNGETVPGATSGVTPSVANNFSNLGFTTIVRVRPSCCAVDNDTVLTVANTGIAANYINANINVVKLC